MRATLEEGFGNGLFGKLQKNAKDIVKELRFVGTRQSPQFDLPTQETAFFYGSGHGSPIRSQQRHCPNNEIVLDCVFEFYRDFLNISNDRSRYAKGIIIRVSNIYLEIVLEIYIDFTLLYTTVWRLPWLHVSEVLAQYEDCKVQFASPHVLQLMRNLQSNDFEAITTKQAQQPSAELQAKLEYAPHVLSIPIPSNTLSPFTQTNLVVIESNSDYLIVDPGASEAGNSKFIDILKTFPKDLALKVFITHHHHDHIEAIPVVEKLFPKAIILAHKNTLERISDTKLKKQPVFDGEEIIIGSVKINVVESLGHTDGHMALFEPKSRSLVAGDHIVGFGSAVLDSTNGDMRKYFDTCKQFISLSPQLALPAHGPPSFTPVQLLQAYIEHRQQREDLILNCYKTGHRTADDIVPLVYKDVPSTMWPFAKRNIELHLRKLMEEGKIPSSF